MQQLHFLISYFDLQLRINLIYFLVSSASIFMWMLG